MPKIPDATSPEMRVAYLGRAGWGASLKRSRGGRADGGGIGIAGCSMCRPPTQDGVWTVPGFLAVGDLTGGSKE